MRVTDNPFEIGMDRLVDLEMEADFVGKEALKKIKKEGIKKTALIIVGEVLNPKYYAYSKLYDKDFEHGYRKKK